MRIRRLAFRPADRQAFTLMEVLVVVAILVVLASVSAIAVFRFLDDSKKDRVKTDLVTLTKACQAYKLRYGEFPQSLEVLLQGNRPYLESPEAILDPWMKQYQYDPSGQNNGGMRPDIFTTDEDGNVIGNWMGINEGR